MIDAKNTTARNMATMTTIIAIDNRARDMAVSAGLTVLARDRMEQLSAMLEGPLDVTPRPDPAPIGAFMDQFA